MNFNNYKECIDEFKDVLYNEIKKYNEDTKKLEEVQLKIEVFIEILDIFYDKENKNINIESIKENKITLGLLLPVIYGAEEGNRLYEIILNDLLSSDKKFHKLKLLFNKLFSEYKNMKFEKRALTDKIINRKNVIIEYRKILSNYKYNNGLITVEQMELIEKLLKKYDFSIKDQIRVFESIRIHNIKNKYEQPNISYTVVDMLNINIEKYDIDGYEDYINKERFSILVESFYTGIKSVLSIEDMIMLMPSLDEKKYSYEEFKYIYESVLNKFIDDINNGIASISDLDIYHDIELRKVVISEYNEAKYRYDKLLRIYEKKKREYNELFENGEKSDEKSSNTFEDKNIIFYEKSSNNSEISYLEKDIKKFPEEYLNKIYYLLEGLKKGSLKRDEIKFFHSVNHVLAGHIELRDDQVRILCKHIKDNCYCVIGALVKKEDNPNKIFAGIVNRGCSIDLSTELLFESNKNLSEAFEEKIYGYIEKNARKGSR